MLLSRPSAFYKDGSRYIVIREDPTKFVHQFVIIRSIKVNPYPKVANADLVGSFYRNVFLREKKKKQNKATSRVQSISIATQMYKQQREQLIVDSEEFVDAYTLAYSQLKQLFSYIRDDGVNIQLTNISQSSRDNEEFVQFSVYGIFYSKKFTTKKDKPLNKFVKDISNFQLDIPPSLEFQPVTDGIELSMDVDNLVVRQGNENVYTLTSSQFERLQSNYHNRHQQSLSNDKEDIPLFETSQIRYHLPKRMTLIGGRNKVNEIIPSLSGKRIIHIGSSLPENFVSLSPEEVKLNLLDLMEEPAQFYLPVLSLIEETFKIQNFSQTFKMFYDLFTDSLSEEQSDKLSLNYMARILKDVPLSSFEIPIDTRDKTILNMFFLHFPTLSQLENKYDNHFSPYLHIPVKRGREKKSLLLLLLTVINASLESAAYDIIIVDDLYITKQIHKDVIIPHLNEINRLYQVYADTNPYRRMYNNYPKLFIDSGTTGINYLQEKVPEVKAFPSENYLLKGKSVFQGNLIVGNDILDNRTKVSVHSETVSREEVDVTINHIAPDKPKSNRSEELLQSQYETSALNTGNSSTSEETPARTEKEDITSYITSLNEEKNSNTTSEENTSRITSRSKDLDKGIEKDVSFVKPIKIQQSKEKMVPDSKQESNNIIKTIEDIEPEDKPTSLTPPPVEVEENTQPINSSSVKKPRGRQEPPELPPYLEVFENIFTTREQVKNPISTEIDPVVLSNILEAGTYNFSILTRLINASTTKLHRNDLERFEARQLEFLSKKKLVQVEGSGEFFITSKGREMISDLISELRSLEITPKHIDLLLAHNDEILEHQKNYGVQTYAHTRLRLAIVLGLRYYEQFKVMPPLILSIFNIYSKKHVTIRDTEEFISLFDAKFVVLLEEYRQDINQDSSRIRDDYIDVEDKPVPRPFEQPTIQREEKVIEISKLKDATIISSVKPVFVKPAKLIHVEETGSLSDEDLIVPEDNPLPPSKISKNVKEKEEKKDFSLHHLNSYTPKQLGPLEFSVILDDFKENYQQSLDHENQELKFSIHPEKFKTVPVIYRKENKEEIDKNQLFDKLVYSLKLPTRIKNIILAEGLIEELKISEFVTTEYTTDIPGIGPSSLQSIQEMQRVLISDDLQSRDIIYFLDKNYIDDVILSSLKLNLDDLPYYVFFPLSDYQEPPSLDNVHSIEEITIIFGEFILQEVFKLDLSEFDSEATDERLSEVITSLILQQKQQFPLLFNQNTNEQDFIRFDDIYRRIQIFNSSKSNDRQEILQEYRNHLLVLYRKILVNRSIFDIS